MGTMIWDYGRMLVLICAAAGLYRVVAVPLIEPAETEAAFDVPNTENGTYAYWWSDIFAEDSWQRKNPKVMETEQGILLFQNFERLGGARWRLSPLTILIPPQNRSPNKEEGLSTKRPILIDAAEGAVIKFKDDIDIFSGKTPPLEDGQLVGKIRIHSPGNKSDQSDSLDIRTEMVRINQRRVWTTQPVELKLGQSYAKGRHLSILLDKNLLASGAPSGGSWDGLDSLELIYVDEVYIEAPKGGLFADTLAKSLLIPPGEKPILDRSAFVQLKCNGAFRFDFHNSRAQLQDDVKIVHQVEGLPEDRFECGTLRLFIDRAAVATPVTPSVSGTSFTAGQPISLGPVQLRKIEAEGAALGNTSPTARYVTFDCPNIGARGVARSFSLDLVKQQLSWMNRLPTEPPHQEPTYLKYAEMEIWSPEIGYRFDGASTHLGWLAAAGPGNAAMTSPQQGRWELGWAKTLQMVPDRSDSRVTLEGDVVIQNSEQGRFSAATLDLWLRPMQELTPNPSQPAGFMAQWLPDRMEAVGEVAINTPQILGNFSTMALWFAYVLDQPSGPGVMASHGAGLNLTTPTGQNQQTWVKQPAGLSADGISSLDSRSRQPAGPPARVSGHRLHGRLLRTQQEMLIDDLTIERGVVLQRESIDASNPLPVVIEGDQLRMSTADGGMADIAVSGKPARIFVGQGWLEGPTVRVNQQDRLVWIDEPGSFGVPVEALQKPGSENTTNTNSMMRWLEAPRCRWQGRMMFDGKVARMDGGVDFFGRVQTNPDTVWHLEGSAAMLEIALNQPLGQSKTNSKIEIQTVSLTENVDLRAAQTDINGVLRSREHMLIPSLAVDLTTQRMVGSGPGSIRSRRPASNRLSGGSANIAAARPNELNCLHLTFAGQLDGYLDRMEFIFARQIEVGMGPIGSWEETLDVAQMQQLSEGQTLMSCELLRVFEATQIPSASLVANQGSASLGLWDLEAENNVVFEGRTPRETFAGSATKLGYQAAKDTVRIIGSPRQSANLQRMPVNEPPARLSIRDASFRLKTMEIIDMQLDQFQLDLQGGIQGAPPTSLPPNGTGITTPSPRDSLFQRRP